MHRPCCPQAKKKATGDLFAIKVMRKADLIRKNMVQSVKNERNILAMANNPFVVRLCRTPRGGVPPPLTLHATASCHFALYPFQMQTALNLLTWR